jgi:hypothetical protein
MLRNRKYLPVHGLASISKQCIPYRLVKILRNRKYLPDTSGVVTYRCHLYVGPIGLSVDNI